MEKIKMGKRKKRRRTRKIRTRRIEYQDRRKEISSRMLIPQEIMQKPQVQKQMANKIMIAVYSIKHHQLLVIQITVDLSQIELLKKRVPRVREISHL